MEKEELEKLLKADLNKVRVIAISDGEITLELGTTYYTLYLDQNLNEDLGWPKDFYIQKGIRRVGEEKLHFRKES